MVGRTLLAAIGLSILHAAPAPCADWDPGASTARLRMPDSLLSLREMYPDLTAGPTRHEFSHEFQPRTSAFPALAPGLELRSSLGPSMSGDLPQTGVWERMGDFRTEDGIRLLTFWQNAGSTVALHQKSGGAALQWTSHSLNRGGASRGLLDQLFSTVRAPYVPARPSATSTPAAPAQLASRFASP
jgi:hypothetical protein